MTAPCELDGSLRVVIDHDPTGQVVVKCPFCGGVERIDTHPTTAINRAHNTGRRA